MKKLLNLMEQLVTVKKGVDGVRTALGELGLTGGYQPQRQVVDIAAPAEAPRALLPPRPENGAPAIAETSYVRNIDERVALIVRLASEGKTHPVIIEFVTRELSRKCGGGWCVPEHDKWKEAQALYKACKKRYRYLSDPSGVDTFKEASRTMEWGGGDCDCWSIMYSACAGAAGIESAVRVIHEHGEATWNHIFPMVLIDGKWLAMDGTVNKGPGWQPPPDRVKRFRDYEIR